MTRFDVASGKTAIITGGASGIGAALSRALSASGSRVVLADRQLDLAEKLAEELRGRGGDATAAQIDVRELAAMKELVRSTVARTGSIDYFFNNAGIAVGGEMDSYTARDWDDVIDVNLRGVAYGIQAAYPTMVKQQSGHIINTASVAGLVTTAAEGSYAASKHAVVGLSKVLRVEAKRHGVRVSVLCPGAIRTPILSGGRFGRINIEGLTEDQMLSMWSIARPMDPDRFAEEALRRIFANEAIIVIPGWWKALWYLERISPSFSARLWGFALDKMRKDLESMGAHATAREE